MQLAQEEAKKDDAKSQKSAQEDQQAVKDDKEMDEKPKNPVTAAHLSNPVGVADKKPSL